MPLHRTQPGKSDPIRLEHPQNNGEFKIDRIVEC